MGVKAFEQLFSMPLEETCISGILGCGLGLKFIPASCNDSCWDGRGRGVCQNLVGLAGSSVHVA